LTARIDQRANIVLVAHIRTDEAGDDHLRALFGEGDGGGASDAGQTAGDQNDLIAHLRLLD
jgi:hypothetical protein